MKLIDPCLTEIEGIDLNSVIEIRIEHLPGNIFKRAYITVKAGIYLPDEITIKYAGYTIFAGNLIGTETDYKSCTVRAIYKNGKALLEPLKGTPLNIFLGEEKKRILFDKLNYKIATAFTHLSAVGLFLQEIRPQYPNGVTYTFLNVNAQPVDIFVPFEFIVTEGVVNSFGEVCFPEYFPSCPEGREVTAHGWIAKNRRPDGSYILPGGEILGWEVEFHETSKNSIKTETLLSEVLKALSPTKALFISRTDFYVWKEFQITHQFSVIDLLNQLLSGIPRVMWYDDDGKLLQVWLDVLKQSYLDLPEEAIFQFSENANRENFPRVIRYEDFAPSRPIPFKVGNIPIPSVVSNAIRTTDADKIPIWSFYNINSSYTYSVRTDYLKPLDREEFLTQTRNVVLRTSGPKQARLRTVLLPTVKPYVGVRVGNKTYFVQGYTHIISKGGAYTELELRGW